MQIHFRKILLRLVLLTLCAAYSAQAQNLPYLQLIKQTAHDGAANADYGWAVAASDGAKVVGARARKVGTKARQGAVYVYAKAGNGWVEPQMLIASDGEAGDEFGTAVAVSGETLVVGAPNHKVGNNARQGAAYVFTRVDGVWTFQQKLTANDGAVNDAFGASVGVSGDTVVAGAFSDDNETKGDQGSAYVFTRTNGVWSFQQKLTANDGAANDQFGAAVAINGDTVLAGALLDDIGNVQDAGSAYFFTRTGTVWTQQQRLSGSNGPGTMSGDLFGAAVALHGDTALIGAPFYDVNGVVNQGMAMVFVRTAGGWAFQKALTANDGLTEDQFGNAVALNGDTALIGAHFDDVGGVSDQGSTYLFTRTGTNWTQRQFFKARDGAARELFGQAVALSDETPIVGAPHTKIANNAAQGALYVYGCGYAVGPALEAGRNSEGAGYFGYAIAVDGDTAVIGVYNDTVRPNVRQGSAYVFARNGASWRESQQIFASDGAPEERFGFAVAISGDVIVVATPYAKGEDREGSGKAYFFTRNGNTWTQTGRAFGQRPLESFGWSVAASGDTVAIGAPGSNVGQNASQGEVALFRRNGSTWVSEGRVTAKEGTASELFGLSVSLASDKLVVGAPGADPFARTHKGSAYVFTRATTGGSTWQQRARLLAPDGLPGDSFGSSVAVSGNTVLASAPGRVLNSQPRQQQAYLFVATDATGASWAHQATLRLGDNDPDSTLPVALDGDTAVIGSGNDYSGAQARVFKRYGTSWGLQQLLTSSTQGGNFGLAVAVSGNNIFVGDPILQLNRGAAYTFALNCAPSPSALACVSAASYAPGAVASESIVAAFGNGLAQDVAVAATQPLPTTLGGARVSVRDSLGMERFASLFFVSPGQINFQMPPGMATGTAQVNVLVNGVSVARGNASIGMVAPGLFAANSNGQGVPAAVLLRVRANGAQSYEAVTRWDGARFVPVPINFGEAGDQLFLALYGTGIRGKQTATARCGGTDTEVLYAGESPGFAGLDQVNLRLPRALAGRGEIDVALIVDGKAANTMRVSIQ